MSGVDHDIPDPAVVLTRDIKHVVGLAEANDAQTGIVLGYNLVDGGVVAKLGHGHVRHVRITTYRNGSDRLVKHVYLRVC